MSYENRVRIIYIISDVPLGALPDMAISARESKVVAGKIFGLVGVVQVEHPPGGVRQAAPMAKYIFDDGSRAEYDVLLPAISGK